VRAWAGNLCLRKILPKENRLWMMESANSDLTQIAENGTAAREALRRGNRRFDSRPEGRMKRKPSCRYPWSADGNRLSMLEARPEGKKPDCNAQRKGERALGITREERLSHATADRVRRSAYPYFTQEEENQASLRRGLTPAAWFRAGNVWHPSGESGRPGLSPACKSPRVPPI